MSEKQAKRNRKLNPNRKVKDVPIRYLINSDEFDVLLEVAKITGHDIHETARGLMLVALRATINVARRENEEAEQETKEEARAQDEHDPDTDGGRDAGTNGVQALEETPTYATDSELQHGATWTGSDSASLPISNPTVGTTGL